jgi:hypothetical protein
MQEVSLRSLDDDLRTFLYSLLTGMLPKEEERRS